MSKILSFFAVILFYSFGFSAIPDNAIDFTAKDVHGTSHTLFSYLSSGKYVLIKFSQIG